MVFVVNPFRCLQFEVFVDHSKPYMWHPKVLLSSLRGLELVEVKSFAFSFLCFSPPCGPR